MLDHKLGKLELRLSKYTESLCPLDGFYSSWPPSITKDKSYEEWLEGEDEDYYMK